MSINVMAKQIEFDIVFLLMMFEFLPISVIIDEKSYHQ